MRMLTCLVLLTAAVSMSYGVPAIIAGSGTFTYASSGDVCSGATDGTTFMVYTDSQCLSHCLDAGVGCKSVKVTQDSGRSDGVEFTCIVQDGSTCTPIPDAVYDSWTRNP